MANSSTAQVLKFDGQSTYIHKLGSALSLGLTNRDFTVEAWIRIDDFSGHADKSILGTDQTGPNNGLHLIVRNRRPFFGFFVNDMTGQTELSTGVWYHLAWRYTTETQEQVLFINGVLDAASTGHAPFQGTGDILIGRWASGRYFNGAMADVRIWDHARPSQAIQSDMQRRLTGTERGLTAYWRLDDGSGGIIAADSSQNGADGELRGDPERMWVDVKPPLTWEADRERVLTFDGEHDRLTISPFKGFPDQELTFECWIRSGDASKAGTIVSYANDQGDNAFLLYDYRNLGPDINDNFEASGVAFNDGQWHHLAVTWRCSTGRTIIYKDGQKQEPDYILSKGVPISDGGSFVLGQEQDALAGRFDPAQAFKGEMTEVRLWSVVRQARQIRSTMHRRFTKKDLETMGGLVGYWPLNNAPEDFAADLSANSQLSQFNGPTWIELKGPLPPEMSDGPKTLHFDGKDDYISVVIDLPETEVTHELWFRTDEANCGIFSVVDREGGGGHDRHIYLRNGNLNVRLWRNEVIGTSGLNLADNQWHHVAHVFGASVSGQQIYIDGELQASGQKGESDFDWQKRILIGYSADAAQPHFKGQIYEVRLWNKARTIDDIRKMLGRRTRGNEPDLIGCWHLDEGRRTIVPDISSYQRDGYFSGPSWEKFALPIETPSGKVLGLDGVNDQVYIDDFRWTNRGPVTVEFWTKVYETDLRKGSLFTLGSQNNPSRFQSNVPWVDRHLYWDYGDNRTSGRAGVDFGPYLGRWTHVALVSQGENGNFMGIYLNGHLVSSTQASDGPKTRLHGLSIGRWNKLIHKGQLTEFRIWRKVRSADEIKADMNRRLAGNEADLAGYWQLDHSAKDSLSSRPGQISGENWISLDAPIQSSLDELPTMPAATFDGLSDHISIPPSETFNTLQTITIEAWAKATDSGKQPHEYPVLSKHGSGTGWELRCGDGKAEFLITLDRHHYPLTVDQGIDLNQWYHLAGTYDGRVFYFYINGVLKGSAALAGTLTPYLGELNIGRNPRWPDRLFAGKISEVRVWNKARSAVEIQAALYQRLSGKESGLIGYWKLDEGSGEVANDSSPGELNGALRGVEWAATPIPLAFGKWSWVEVEVDPEAHLNKLRSERESLQAQLVQAQAEAQRLKQNELALQKQLDDARNRVRELDKEKEDLIDTHQNTVSQIKEQESSRRDKLIQEGGAVTLSELIRNTNQEITQAREELQRQGGNYRLGRVAIELKMVAAADGTGMIFPKPEEMGQANQLSTVNLDFAPKEVVEEAPEDGNEVPSVIGYTELLARRKLSEAGLVMAVKYQAVALEEGQPSWEDRVVNQHPKPEAKAQPLSTVEVFIGKLS